MPRVFIPPLLRALTEGQEVVEVPGKNVGQVIEALEGQFPGIRSRLCDDDGLQAGISVVVGGSFSSLGLHQRTEPESEVHFLPAIGGG